MISSVMITAGIVLLTQICKKYVFPKWSDTGVHVFIFVVAFLVVAVRAYASYNPTFGHLIVVAGEYLAASIASYEVLLKQIWPSATPVDNGLQD